MPIGYLLSDYWAWNASDLLNNTLRGSFCEFIVSAALGIDLSEVNEDWGAYDVTFPYSWRCGDSERSEVHIEVKSSAYLQAWANAKPSHIQYSIRPTRAWTPDGGYADTVVRQSDVYVFCLYAVQDRNQADPLVLDGWEFYVMPTRRLDEICGPQKTISLPSLLTLKPFKTDYAGLKDAVIAALQ